MSELRRELGEKGYVVLPGFFPAAEIHSVRREAQRFFETQIRHLGLINRPIDDEATLEAKMIELFRRDRQAFLGAAKLCQHSIAMHRLALSERIVSQLGRLGFTQPVICTRPVMYFNSRHLAEEEVYYKTPPHQDWRSMQGSLDSTVVWLPLVAIDRKLGALEIVPKSHLQGLYSCGENKAGFCGLKETIGENEYIALEVDVGDAVFFSSFLVHRSGNNITDGVRWSMHFRYNNADEPTFIERKYPVPYIYKPTMETITPEFPTVRELEELWKS